MSQRATKSAANPPVRAEATSRRQSPVRILAKIGLALLAIEWWVRASFVPGVVLPPYVTSSRLLRDSTAGTRLPIFFDAVDAIPPNEVRIAFVGDSTMVGLGDWADTATIAFAAVDTLQRRMGGGEFKAVDASQIGLYGGDAALFVAKLLGRGVDVLAYGVCPRAFPRNPENRWVSRVSSQLGSGDLWRLVRAGGSQWLLANLSAEQVLGGLVNTSWTSYAYRSTLSDALRKEAVAPLLARLNYADLARRVAADAAPEPQAPVRLPPIGQRPQAATPYEWTFDSLGYPNANWEALELIGRLCQRYLPGRCLIYAVPINPRAPNHNAEPGFYEDYLAHLRMIAGRYGLVFRDFTDALTPDDFLPPNFPRQYDPMHPNRAGRLKFGPMLTEALLEATRNKMSQAAVQSHR